MVQEATGKLAQDEVSALHDPVYRDQAARWRSGSEARRIAAAFARLINSLHVIRPGWLKSQQASVVAPDEPPAVEPLPVLNQKGSSSPGSFGWKLGVASKGLEYVMTWCCSRWRTLMVLGCCLAFPRLLALLIAAALRLVIRAFMAILSRALQEMWSELKVGLRQLTMASTSVEQLLIDQLEGVLFDPPVPLQAPQTMIGPAGVPYYAPPPVAPAPPSPPWAFFSMLLLLLLVALQLLPLLRTGGLGGLQPEEK